MEDDNNDKKQSCWGRFKNFICGNKEIQPTVANQQLDKNISKGLDVWSSKTLGRQQSDERASWVAELKSQLERYEMELALRQMCQGINSSKLRKLKSTDDSLPYELKPISTNWSLALSRLSKLQSSMASSEEADVGGNGSLEAVVAEESTVATEKQEKDSAKCPPTSSASTSTPSSVEEMEKASHLSDLIMEIMKEAGEISKSEKSELPELSKENLAKLSHFEPQKFEYEILENTKKSLLSSQPTVAETTAWYNGRAKSKEFDGKMSFPKQDPEIRTFCNCRKQSCSNNTDMN